MENVKEIDNLLHRYHISNLNQDQVNNLNRPITCKEIEAVIKRLPSKKFRVDDFSAEFYQNFKEELILILFKLFHIIQQKEHCKTFDETQLT